MAVKTILVTGGAGFIGAWFVRHLVETYPSYQVITLDALTYAGNLENLSSVQHAPNHRFVHGDIRNRELVAELMATTDICVNIAAQTHVDRSISGPSVFIETNVNGTQTLLEAARLKGIEKFVQVSTDEVYGSIAPPARFTENSPLVPSSPYSASKAAADLIAISYFKTYGLPVCITRCCNNYGPQQYPEKLIPLFILNALQDKPLPVYGDGKNVREWIHVSDHNRAVDRVMHEGVAGEVYNIGSDVELENIALTEQILAALGKPKTLMTYVTDRPGHDRRYAVDSSKITSQLGWQPLVSFEEGLLATIDWYQNNPQWLAGVQKRSQANNPLQTTAAL